MVRYGAKKKCAQLIIYMQCLCSVLYVMCMLT